MKELPTLKTDFRLRKEAWEDSVYDDFQALMSKSGAQQAAVEQFLMKKHSIYSRTTIWAIKKRVAARRDNAIAK